MAEVALIVGGGPGISASCARLFAQQGMSVAIAARNPGKPALTKLVEEHGVKVYECDAAEPDSVAALFATVSKDLGSPRLVVHNIDGRTQHIFRKDITEADPGLVLDTIKNSAYSAFLVGQQAAIAMLANNANDDDHRGTIIFTNASAALKGYAKSGAFAIASHGSRDYSVGHMNVRFSVILPQPHYQFSTHGRSTTSNVQVERCCRWRCR